MSGLSETMFGFIWGPVEVKRLATWPTSGASRLARSVGLTTRYHSVEVYVSPTGKRVRVFKNGVEMFPTNEVDR